MICLYISLHCNSVAKTSNAVHFRFLLENITHPREPPQALFPLFPHGQNLKTLPHPRYGQGKEVTVKRNLTSSHDVVTDLGLVTKRAHLSRSCLGFFDEGVFLCGCFRAAGGVLLCPSHSEPRPSKSEWACILSRGHHNYVTGSNRTSLFRKSYFRAPEHLQHTFSQSNTYGTYRTCHVTPIMVHACYEYLQL